MLKSVSKLTTASYFSSESAFNFMNSRAPQHPPSLGIFVLRLGGKTQGVRTIVKYFLISCNSFSGMFIRYVRVLHALAFAPGEEHFVASLPSSGASCAGNRSTRSASVFCAAFFILLYQDELNCHAMYSSNVMVIAAFFDAPGVHCCGSRGSTQVAALPSNKHVIAGADLPFPGRSLSVRLSAATLSSTVAFEASSREPTVAVSNDI